jgi:hypothetical protein
MPFNYIPQLPERELIEELSNDCSRSITTQLFASSMPKLQKLANNALGELAAGLRESDPELAEQIDNVSVNGEAVERIMETILMNIREDTQDEITGDSNVTVPERDGIGVEGLGESDGSGDSGESEAGE